jgi:hypothetical protein
MTQLSLRDFAQQTGKLPPPPGTLSLRNLARSLSEPNPISLRHFMQFPRVPDNLLPNGQPPTLLNVVLSWNDPGAGTYREAASFSISSPDLGIVTTVIVRSPDHSYQIPGVLEYNKVYNWSVAALNDAGESSPANATFEAFIPSPKNLEPATGTNDVQVNPTLSWIDPGAALGSPATSFQLVITSTYDARAPFTFMTGATNFAVPITLLYSSVYNWSVAGAYYKSANPYTFTTSASFTTIASG